MSALDVLMSEHGLIRQYLANLSFAVQKLERGEHPPREFFEQVVLFAREFVDGYHHFKEEHQTFVALAQAHSGKLDGPLSALRLQHERGRSLVTAMADSIQGYAEHRANDEMRMLESLASFTALLRAHINREDHIFFPLASATLSEQEHRELAAEFRRVDDKAGEGFLAEYQDRVLKMEALLTRP